MRCFYCYKYVHDKSVGMQMWSNRHTQAGFQEHMPTYHPGWYCCSCSGGLSHPSLYRDQGELNNAEQMLTRALIRKQEVLVLALSRALQWLWV